MAAELNDYEAPQNSAVSGVGELILPLGYFRAHTVLLINRREKMTDTVGIAGHRIRVLSPASW